MALELTSGMNVYRDENETIRQIDHNDQYYASRNFNQPSPRELAEEYLQEVAPHFKFSNTTVSNLSKKSKGDFTEGDTEELHYLKEKQVGNIAVVTFEQTVKGLPIWSSHVSVRVNANRLVVIASVNEAHYNINLKEFNVKEVSFNEETITSLTLAKLLNFGKNDKPPVINAIRKLVYQFKNSERIEHEGYATELTGIQESTPPSFNLLDLDDEQYFDDNYYVVTEVLFTAATKGYGDINWRTFIDPLTGSVLYLRAFVSHINGAIFEIDPATQGCFTCTGASSNNDLNKYVSQVPLEGLNPPVNKQQSLEGHYITMKDIRPPNIVPPKQPTGNDFIYNPDDNGFAAVNAYYHCDLFFRYLDSLGIDIPTYFNGTTFPVSVDARGKNNSVNASCGGNAAGNGIGNILFGLVEQGHTLGIASALRVVWHEFGHGLLWNHVDSPNFGFAHSAGDAMACIYADPSNLYPDKGLTFPFMVLSGSGINRRNDRTVLQGWAWFGPQYNTQYSGEQVLSSTLFRAYLATGGRSTNLAYKQFASMYMLYLIVQSCGLLTQTTRDPKIYVTALKNADMHSEDFTNKTGFTGGTNHKVIRWSFMEQGLFQAPRTPLPITTVGQPPKVDIYINDGRNGIYTWTDDWQDSPDIWNRNSADGGVQNQNPIFGSENYLYIKVSNRGTQSASNITIKGYQSNSETEFNWPTNWVALNTPSIHVAGPVTSNGNAITGPFKWIPEHQGTNGILMMASNIEDPNILENNVIQGGTLENWRLVPFDNNIAQRNLTSEPSSSSV